TRRFQGHAVRQHLRHRGRCRSQRRRTARLPPAAQDRNPWGHHYLDKGSGLHTQAGDGVGPMTIQRTRSLRTRLFILLVVPLIAVSVASTVLRYWTAQEMSQHLYDDTLRVVAHAVAREVVLTRGDLVADELFDSLVGALGDPIYYQVRADGGRFITGHSDAPIPPASLEVTDKNPVFFNSNYQGRPVRSV